MFSGLLDFIRKEEIASLNFDHHRILKDETLNAKLVRDGYVVLPLLDEGQVAYMKDLYHKWHKDDQPVNFYKSYYSRDAEYINDVESKVFEFLRPQFEQYFIAFDLMGGMFVAKPYGLEGHIPPHQDFSLVDESKYWALNSWCPLDDTSEDFGILKILPGSHRFMKTIRGYGVPEHYSHLTETIEKHFVPIEMKAGEVVIFYLSIVHGSSFNTRKDPRVAVGCSIIPENIKLEYTMIPDGEKHIKKYAVDKSFFANNTNKNSKPNDDFLVETIKPNFRKLSRRQLENKIEAFKNSKI